MIVITVSLQNFVKEIEKTATDGRDRPVQPVKIVDCGSEKVDTPFSVEKADAVE